MRPTVRSRTSESGQTVILFIFALAALCGFAALAIDVGTIMAERGKLQGAADASAIAAAQHLPSVTLATESALAFAAENGYTDGVDGVEVTVTTPYNGDYQMVHVSITTEADVYFAPVLGTDVSTVSAGGAASILSGGYGDAIFAYGSGCGNPNDIEMSGADFDITGSIHTNGDVKMSSSDMDVEGVVSYLCDPPQINGNDFDASRGVNLLSEKRDWPVYYEYADFGPCTFASAVDMVIGRESPQYWVNDDPDTNTLKPGVYCSEANIQVTKQASGTVTFVAKGQILVEATNGETGQFNFTAYQNDVVMFSSFDTESATVEPTSGKPKPEVDTSAIHVSASSFEWEGILQATDGKLQLSGSQASSPSGSLMGETVKISSSSGTITGLWDDTGLRPGWLVE